jgi:hypothetical protein
LAVAKKAQIPCTSSGALNCTATLLSCLLPTHVLCCSVVQLGKRIQLNALDKAFLSTTWLHAKWVEYVMADEVRSFMLCVPLAQQVGARCLWLTCKVLLH